MKALFENPFFIPFVLVLVSAIVGPTLLTILHRKETVATVTLQRAQTDQSERGTELAKEQTISTQVKTLIDINTSLIGRVSDLTAELAKAVAAYAAQTLLIAASDAKIVIMAAQVEAQSLIIVALNENVKALGEASTQSTIEHTAEILRLNGVITSLEKKVAELELEIVAFKTKSEADNATILALVTKLSKPADGSPTVGDVADGKSAQPKAEAGKVAAQSAADVVASAATPTVAAPAAAVGAVEATGAANSAGLEIDKPIPFHVEVTPETQKP